MDEGKKSAETSEHLTDKASSSKEYRPGPTWRAWTVSIVAAIILSVTAALLLGGTSSFRPESVTSASVDGCGGGCCGAAEK